MRRLLFATLTLACAPALAAVEYTSANAKISLNVDPSVFGNASITEVPATGSSAGYSQITLIKSFYPGLAWLDVTITNLQAGAALTFASASLSVFSPGGATWLDVPRGTMFVESPVTTTQVMTQSASNVTLVNESLAAGGSQSFHLDSIGVSGRGFSFSSGTYVMPTGLLALTFRVSNVPELSSGTMALTGALLLPLAVGLHRRHRPIKA